MDSNELSEEQIQEVKHFLDTATGHIGETTRTMLSLLKQWGFSSLNPQHLNEILLTRLAVQRAQIFKSLNAPCREDLLMRPAADNIYDFIVKPIRSKSELHNSAFQYDTVDFSKELPLYLFMLMMIERLEKRKQLYNNQAAGPIAINLIYDICKKEFSEFAKLNEFNSIMFGAVVFIEILEKLGLTERNI